ncbi:mycothiol synthase [Dermacoccaceae bacterium W4C1]
MTGDSVSPTADQVIALGAAAEAADGVAPFSEQPLLDLRSHADGLPAEVRTLVVDGALVAATLSADEDPDSVELTVHPDHRRAGHGRALLEQVHADRPQARVWAHGNLPAAQGLAAAARMRPVRELWRMELDLVANPPQLRPLPAGYSARTFRPGQDDAAWLSVNARAFAHHPEQGRMTQADLDARMAEPWFDPEGLILVTDDQGEVVASHWTKVPVPADGSAPQVGEVYVVAVDPAHQGRGLGGPLTGLGLSYLEGRQLKTVELYVEADNDPAVATYRRLGFEPAAVDTQYAW